MIYLLSPSLPFPEENKRRRKELLQPLLSKGREEEEKCWVVLLVLHNLHASALRGSRVVDCDLRRASFQERASCELLSLLLCHCEEENGRMTLSVRLRKMKKECNE